MRVALRGKVGLELKYSTLGLTDLLVHSNTGEYSVSGSRAVCKIVAIAARVVRLHLPPPILTIKEIRVRIPRTQQAA